MKKSSSSFLRRNAVRLAVLLAALAISGFGAACYVKAALGNDPFTAFVQGLGLCLGVSFGAAMTLVNGVALVVVFWGDRRLIHVGAVLSFLLGGAVSEAFVSLLGILVGAQPSLAVRIALVLAATLSVGFGVGLYQAARLGASPPDAMNQIIAAKLRVPLKWERMAYDALLLALALPLGGTIHVGTVAGVFLIGPVMAATFARFTPAVDRWAAWASAKGRFF